MKKLMSGLAIAAIASTALVGAASAQWTDTASGGNGGVSTADSSGGAVSIGSTNSGGGSGNSTSTGGSSGGNVVLGGGTLTTSDDLAATIIAAVLAAQ
jgi:hypothetical protein